LAEVHGNRKLVIRFKYLFLLNWFLSIGTLSAREKYFY